MTSARQKIRGIDDIRALEQVPYEDRNCEKTIFELVKDGALRDPEKVAFYNLPTGDPKEDAEIILFSELLEQIHQAANLFNELGVGKNDVVAVLLPIVPQYVVSMIAAATIGILCPINWMLKADHIAGILNAVEAKVLIALAPTEGYEIWSKVEAIEPQVGSLKHVLQVALPGNEVESDVSFDHLLKSQPGDRLNFKYDRTPDDIAIYAHTGGTTGVPKVAQLRNGAFAYKSWAYSEILSCKPEHVVFAGSPLFHIGGIVYHTINTLSHGSTSLMVGPMGFRSKNIIDNYWYLVEKYKITDFFGVPTTLSALANIPPGTADISTLRPYCMTGSAGLPIEISRYFENEIGVRILCNYGMTENTATIALPPRDGDPRYGSSGIRLPYTQIRIVKLDGDKNIQRDCDANEIGDIIVKGPGITPGYLDDQFNADLFLEGGWLLTGDLGRLDEDEYLWVTGRAKDVIIRGGNNIDPLVIEDAIRKHQDVALVGAVGQPDAYAGELPVAYVQLKPSKHVDTDELMKVAEANISERSALPKKITIVDQLPLTAVGKIFKPELRKLAATQTFTELLAPLSRLGGACSVEILDHAVYGSLCQISVALRDESDKPEIEAQIAKVMGEFTMQFEIEWRD
ncbi:MAG: acyl-CoA synthetase [Rhodospirillaceae bacterium]|jgi:fatty-acyl-CoA synthase|nr:acyl-CoA synthetase [Rhodospirillaceae bacterium]